MPSPLPDDVLNEIVNNMLPSLAWIALLIGLHALTRFSITALLNARRNALRERAETGDRRARRALALTDHQDRLQAGGDMVLMFLRFGIAAFLAVDIGMALDVILRAQIGWQLSPTVGYIVEIFLVALVTYFLAELGAGAMGRAWADVAAPRVAWVARTVLFILSPLIALALAFDRAISRAGGEPLNKAVTEEEIIALVEEGQESGTIEDEEKEMIHSVLQFGETLAREIMIPRQDITGIEINEPLSEALKTIVESGHSRIPVYENTVDRIRGLLYAKDLLNVLHRNAVAQATIRAMLRPAYFVPETKRADLLFKEMQERKVHIALIIDEYGGTAGLVTIEDLIEEILGDIRDEYDANETEDYIKHGEHAYILDGGMNLGDLNELLDIELPTDENDSIGGFVYTVLGRVPEVGDVIEDDARGLFLRIEAVENRRIRKIFAEKREPKPQPSPTTGRTRESASASNSTGTTAVTRTPTTPLPAAIPTATAIVPAVTATTVSNGTEAVQPATPVTPDAPASLEISPVAPSTISPTPDVPASPETSATISPVEPPTITPPDVSPSPTPTIAPTSDT